MRGELQSHVRYPLAILALATLSACVSLGDYAAPSTPEGRKALLVSYFTLQSDLVWAEYEFGCNKTERADKRAFGAKYSSRLKSANAWFSENFSDEELNWSFGDQIMAGACKRDARGRSIMRSELRFAEQLSSLEDEIRQGEKR